MEITKSSSSNIIYVRKISKFYITFSVHPVVITLNTGVYVA